MASGSTGPVGMPVDVGASQGVTPLAVVAPMPLTGHPDQGIMRVVAWPEMVWIHAGLHSTLMIQERRGLADQN